MVVRSVRRSILKNNECPSSVTDDFSVSNSRDVKISAKGGACLVEAVVEVVVWFISESFVLVDQKNWRHG